MKKYIGMAFVFLALAAIAIFALHQSNPKIGTSKLTVTASFYPLYFFASEISGEKADVANITPAGAEPHDYEPTAQDRARMADSALTVINGGGLEAWGSKISGNVVVAGDGLTTRELAEEGSALTTDPHVWLSPRLAERMVDAVAQGFVQADSANAAYYTANADMLKQQLSALDAEYAAGLSHCAKKDMVTSHSAFGYLADAYGLNQVSIAGLSPDAEPSPKQLADIVAFARAHDVRYIFFESLVSPKLAQTIATEVGAQTLVLNPLEGLTPDELAAGQNYFTVMRQNLANLKIALQCQ